MAEMLNTDGDPPPASPPRGRPKLMLKKRDPAAAARLAQTRSRGSNPFGDAKPREEVLTSKGVDVKAMDRKTELKAQAAHRLTRQQREEADALAAEVKNAENALQEANEKELPENALRATLETKRSSRRPIEKPGRRRGRARARARAGRAGVPSAPSRRRPSRRAGPRRPAAPTRRRPRGPSPPSSGAGGPSRPSSEPAGSAPAAVARRGREEGKYHSLGAHHSYNTCYPLHRPWRPRFCAFRRSACGSVRSQRCGPRVPTRATSTS